MPPAPNHLAEIQTLRRDLDNLTNKTNDHLIECARANAALDLKMRFALGGITVVLILTSMDNPVVRAMLTVVGLHK